MKPPDLVAATGSLRPTTTIPTLVRRLGEREVPASGTWSLVTTSHVAIAHDRRDHPVRARIVAGAFEIDEQPEHSTVRIDLDGPEPMTFEGRPTAVVADRHGLSQWSIAGTLTHGGRAEPMSFTVSYHGVFRSRGRAWAWFSGTGALQRPKRARWWRRTPKFDQRLVVLDVLLDSPEPPRSKGSMRRAA